MNSNLTQTKQLLCSQEDQAARITELTQALDESHDYKDKLSKKFENCSNLLLEVEEKLQETQSISLQLLKRCQMKDE